MGLSQMRLSFSSEDCSGAVVARTPEQLMFLSCVFQHLIFAQKCFLTVAFKALVFSLGIVKSRNVSLEITFLSKWLPVRAAWICAE